MFTRSANRVAACIALFLSMLCAAWPSAAQNVVTQHNDIGRTGANTAEATLTPANVTSSTFGKLFYYTVDGYIYAQPLYVAGVTIGGAQHNVVYVATEHDSVYAFDADGNLGANAKPLWQITLLDSAHGATVSGATPEPSSDFGYTDLVPEVGITSTPVIDTSSKTMYLVGKTKESGNYFYRLHALDITTGAEKFGGPVEISASVPGNGSGSVSGTLSFDPTFQLQRPGLLLLNGIVYVAFGATYDVTRIWHGWIFGYRASTLQRSGVWVGSPNGNGASFWQGGAGLAADVVDPTGHPYGRLFAGTGDGSFNKGDGSTNPPTPPYSNAMDYAISVLRLDLANGVPTMNSNGTQVGDMFAPFDQAKLDSQDSDQASGGALVLPDAVSGGKHLMVQVGKSGRIYVLDRDNLGGFTPTNTSDPQQKAAVGGGMFGLPAYWNGHLYFWPASGGGPLKSYSFSNGALSAAPTATSAEMSAFPGATPSVSSNGTSNGIVWTVRTDGFGTGAPAILYAHNATTTTSAIPLLYSTQQNPVRDAPGPAVKFAVPTVINGKVYVGTQNQLAVYGLLNGATQAAAPVINPAGQVFTSPLQISLGDSTTNAQIYYTTDGTTPSTGSTLYTGPFTITKSTTIKAIAAGTGLLASSVSSETYTFVNQAPTPTFTPVPGNYTSAQAVTISDTLQGAKIYYTTDGSTPTTSSTLYTAPVQISATATLKAIATGSGISNSFVAGGLYTISSGAGGSVNFSGGFTSTGLTLVGKSKLSGSSLRLTDGGQTEASATWFNSQVNVQSFSTDFMFHQVPGTLPMADGITFAIQRAGLSALGSYGAGLGYGPQPTGGASIGNSAAVKFALFNNGKCKNCTGFYTNGAMPVLPEITLAGGIDLQSGHVFAAHITYNGTTLTMTVTDTENSNQTFTTSWPVDIPGTIGGNTAFVGFTASTGHYTLVQDILNWTFVSNSGSSNPPAATPVISPATGTYTSSQTVTITDSTSGSSIFYTTDGSQPTTSSTLYTNSFVVNSTTTVKAIATASGFTQSGTATSVITISVAQSPAATPVITPGTGTYSSAQTVSISDSTSGASIFYTLDGSQPTTSSTRYSGSFSISSTTTVKAIATASGFTQSATATSVITIQSGGGGSTINFANGFTSSTGLQFNGRAKLNSGVLQLTDGGAGEASSAWFTTPVNVQSFTTDFRLQLINPNADGMTFAIQNAGLTALGPSGGGLGYGAGLPGGTPGIASSVAVKFDLFQNSHEGNNSTGLYVNGASPTSPATTLGGGVSLHSGDAMQVHITYDGTTLTMTITDTVTAATFTTSWAINIPGTVGGTTALVGFTAGTGGQTATQDVVNWTYSAGGSSQQPAATPVISPATGTYSSSQTVTITDSTSGSSIFYTIDGSQPTTSSTLYTNSFVVNSTTTVKAIATASGFTQSGTATSVITISVAQSPAATPVITPATGTYSSAQTVSISDSTSGASIFYTLDGSQPTTSSTLYSGSFSVSSTTTVKAVATASGFTQSATATSVITIQSGGGGSTINFANGFTSSTGLQFNGRAKLNSGVLQLTDGGAGEASSAWFTTPVNVQSFTTDFRLQLINPNADGMTFAIQNAGLTALGPSGGGLGYGAGLPGGTPGIASSVAVKFDLFQNSHEGNNSTGLYVDGASPTSPATTLGGGVSLHSGNAMQVHITYDGTTLTMTITDTVTAATFTTSWAINIPGTVGGSTALVGFTAGTGGQTATQQIINWTYGP